MENQMQENSAGKKCGRSADSNRRRETYQFILSDDTIASLEELCSCEKMSEVAALQKLVINPEFVMAGLEIVEAQRTVDNHREFQVAFSICSPYKHC